MDREQRQWNELSQAIFDVERARPTGTRFSFSIALIVRVYLFAALWSKPGSWACRPRNWPVTMRPRTLPSQSTFSRRTRTAAFDEFFAALGKRLAGKPTLRLLKRLDGKPLAVAAHSTDKDSTWGRGAGQMTRGYKLHAVWSDRPMPEAFEVQPLDVSEQEAATRLIPLLTGGGYLLADKLFNDSTLFDLAAAHNHRLVAQRVKPHTGLGHCYQSPHRLSCIDLLEPGIARRCRFGAALVKERGQIERDFGNLVTTGLQNLPSFVRTLPRVRRWVTAKLIINAARIRVLRKSTAKKKPVAA